MHTYSFYFQSQGAVNSVTMTIFWLLFASIVGYVRGNMFSSPYKYSRVITYRSRFVVQQVT